ncbi:tol-pal system YbgF family protein, partial [Planctomycetota bacterium]
MALVGICLGILLAYPKPAGSQEISPDNGSRQMVSQEQSHDYIVRSTRHITQKLWKSRTGAPQKTSDASQEDLAALIAKLRGVQYRPPTTASAQPATPASVDANSMAAAAVTEPNQAMQPVIHPAAVVAVPVPTSGILSAETLAMLKAWPQTSQDGDQALRFAELLFTCGYIEQAITFYEHAVHNLDPNAPLFEDNKAWALYQWGNCMRETEPVRAKQAYQQLNTEFPTSPWAPLAAVEYDLSDWYW